ncbi:MAG: hemerythrin domain-containing protein [Pirellulaceae bacterium]
MLDTHSPLVAEFLKDHQQFSRLLLAITRLLEENKIDEARQRARELDQVAGPHIEYEERELYARLKELGETRVTNELLVGEHHKIRDAMNLLLENEKLDEDQLQQAKQGFESGIHHAEHCGSLISLMTRLDSDQQVASLVVLKELRDEGRKWSEF